jgi:hypothetical protein
MSMKQSRRKFLTMLGIAGGAVVVIGPLKWFETTSRASELLSPTLAADELEALAGAAFARASELGCSQAAVQITYSRTGSVLRPTDHAAVLTSATPTGLPAVVESARMGFTVRVAHSDAWGLAQSESVGAESLSAREEEIERLTALAAADALANASCAEQSAALVPATDSEGRWANLRRRHHFDIPARAQRAFRQALNALKAGSEVTVRGEETYFVSTASDYKHAFGTSLA